MTWATSTTTFEQAQQDVKTLSKRPSNDDLTFLYGHYKQATQGDVTGSRPGRLDMIGRAKYDAPAKASGMTAEDAMQRYVDKVASLRERHG
jgi:acyl-CoA-binding protein